MVVIVVVFSPDPETRGDEMNKQDPKHKGCGGEVVPDEHLDPYCLKCEKYIEPEDVE